MQIASDTSDGYRKPYSRHYRVSELSAKGQKARIHHHIPMAEALNHSTPSCSRDNCLLESAAGHSNPVFARARPENLGGNGGNPPPVFFYLSKH